MTVFTYTTNGIMNGFTRVQIRRLLPQSFASWGGKAMQSSKTTNNESGNHLHHSLDDHRDQRGKRKHGLWTMYFRHLTWQKGWYCAALGKYELFQRETGWQTDSRSCRMQSTHRQRTFATALEFSRFKHLEKQYKKILNVTQPRTWLNLPALQGLPSLLQEVKITLNYLPSWWLGLPRT